MNGALQAARLPELDREAAISMCNMVMADLRGECDYGAVVSNVLRAAYPAATPDPPSDRNIARMFHEAYERLAPEFGYRTREESAVPWEKVPAKNRDLMTATVGEVRAHLAAASPDERLREAEPREAITALLAAARVAGVDARSALRGAPSHTGADLLNALKAEGWVLAAADREKLERICCRGMGADGGCNICAAEATR
jgi:hypothetical protein